MFLALVLSHSDLMQRPPRAHTSGCNPCAADVACLFWQLRSNWSLRRHQTWIPPPHCPLVSPTSLCRLPSTHVPRFSLLLPHRVPSPLYAHMLSLHTSLRRHVGFFSPRHQRPSAAPLTPAFMLGPLEPFPHTAAGGPSHRGQIILLPRFAPSRLCPCVHGRPDPELTVNSGRVKQSQSVCPHWLAFSLDAAFLGPFTGSASESPPADFMHTAFLQRGPASAPLQSCYSAMTAASRCPRPSVAHNITLSLLTYLIYLFI